MLIVTENKFGKHVIYINKYLRHPFRFKRNESSKGKQIPIELCQLNSTSLLQLNAQLNQMPSRLPTKRQLLPNEIVLSIFRRTHVYAYEKRQQTKDIRTLKSWRRVAKIKKKKKKHENNDWDGRLKLRCILTSVCHVKYMHTDMFVYSMQKC